MTVVKQPLDVTGYHRGMAVIDRLIEYLKTHADEGGVLVGVHYQEQMAAVIGCSVRHLRRAIRQLEALDLLETFCHGCNEWECKPLTYFFKGRSCPTITDQSTNSTNLASDEANIPKKKPVSIEKRAINKIRRARYVRQFVDKVMDSGAATARAALEVLSWHVKRYGCLLDVLRYNALYRALRT